MVPRTLVIVVCLIAGGCQPSFPEPRAVAKGFQGQGGVLAPYDDGKLHLMAGRYGLAIERFGQALASDRRSLDSLNGLAIAYTRLGRFEVAQAYFERALEIDALNAPTLNNYGRALLEQGRLRDARPFLRLAMDHAAGLDRAIVAANVESIDQTRPPAVVAVLRETFAAPAIHDHRLIRLAANRYQLKTPQLSSPARRATGAHPVSARDAFYRLEPAAGLAAPARRALPETHLPVVVAGGAGGLGLALATAADLEALGIDPETLAIGLRSTTPHHPTPPRPAVQDRDAAPLPTLGGLT